MIHTTMVLTKSLESPVLSDALPEGYSLQLCDSRSDDVLYVKIP